MYDPPRRRLLTKLASPSQRSTEATLQRPRITTFKKRHNQQKQYHNRHQELDLLHQQNMNIQIKLINDIIQNYGSSLNYCGLANSIQQSCFELGFTIERKEDSIRKLHKQIEQIKDSQVHVAHKPPKTNFYSQKHLGARNQNVLNQLQKQRKIFEELISKHQNANHRIQQIKQKIKLVSSLYVAQCLQSKQQPLQFQHFKIYKQTKKQQQQRQAIAAKKKQSAISTNRPLAARRRASSVKQLITKDYSCDKSSSSIGSARQKKRTITKALSTTKKKYYVESQEMIDQLIFLQDQDLLLSEKIQELHRQIYKVETDVSLYSFRTPTKQDISTRQDISHQFLP